MRRHPLALAVHGTLGLALCSSALAQQPAHHEERAEQLDAVVVTATPLKQTAEELTRPVSVLAGPELDDRRGATLGDTVSSIPGVHSADFGPGVGRPVIRGLDGARVQTLSSGLSSLDASTVSADHAVAIEPFLAEQIEVLKGPSTLLYGSGAIGGAVNVVDGRIAEYGMSDEQPPRGRFELRGDTAADQRNAMFKVQAGNEGFVLSADGLHRETDDLEIPGFAESAALLAEEGETPDADEFGLLPNSSTRTSAGGLGASWIGERGFIGIAFSGLDTLYGIPGHAHEHEEEEDEEEGEGHNHDEGESVRIDMEQRRYEAKGALLQPFGGHDSISLRVARTDYQHVELEGEEIGTRFDNQGTEARLEAVHAETAGWRGAWGLQYGRRDFKAVGEEAFVPPSLSRDLGLFLIEQRKLNQDLALELGLRVDDAEIDPDNAASADFTSISGSASLRWGISDDFHLSAGLDHAERAPTAEELFSDGPHIATQSYEVGDPELDTETANRLEFGAHWHSERTSVKAALYTTRFDRFIYLADTGLEEDELPLRPWRQGDAKFNGFELEVEQNLGEWQHGRWDLRFSADAVRARLDSGEDLPRIPAARFAAQLRWEKDGWRARLGAVRYSDQDRVASFERPSDGYTLLDAHLAYHFDYNDVGWELFLDGKNLSDREARPHTSFLKDLAPLPGRNIQFGVRALF
ncbi:TonB-dependent receptor domain-containing protein [Pseudomarimonas arenosa]|uniref:TonB-dependent receptor n=1 Tax=Pseudomarimonas arenosa TaxID=2774145 RepID=A0AAW3ZJS9_9GAMM|nr:TonB-dependent receptor [Pseudomarimonas arenosa]MBD8525710.1 TonB-dependent receptor [Pseudomarimonas arenosa]